jgi:rare lipoprotein A
MFIRLIVASFTVSLVIVGAARAESGIASVYAYSGSKTASGQRAHPGGLTAAHRRLPFGTMVRVTNRRNGKSVVVRINDRGPFVRGRVIDLTPAGARVLGFSGLTPVTLAVLNGSSGATVR